MPEVEVYTPLSSHLIHISTNGITWYFVNLGAGAAGDQTTDGRHPHSWMRKFARTRKVEGLFVCLFVGSWGCDL